MQPQGSSLINAAYYDSLTAEINQINACAALQIAVNQIMASLQAEVTAIENQIAALLPLITLPTDLGSVITWIGHLAGPLIRQYETYLAQLTATLAAIANLVTAIENAAARLVSCSITIPVISH